MVRITQTIGGANFVSLRKGDDANQLEEVSCEILDATDECENFLDTAALIEPLDLVISVDTSAAHQAGALGKPIWLLNRFESVWQRKLDREDTP